MNNATFLEIQVWLRTYHRTYISAAQISRQYKIWNEEKIDSPTFILNEYECSQLNTQLSCVKKRVRKNRKIRKRRIERHKNQILEMREEGHSLAVIQYFLRKEKRLKISRMTIWRSIQRWENFSKGMTQKPQQL